MPSSKNCHWGGLINISSIVSFRPPRHFFLLFFWHFFVIIVIVWQINKYKYKSFKEGLGCCVRTMLEKMARKFRTLCGCKIAELHPQNDSRPQETDYMKWNIFARFYETAPKVAYVFKTVYLKVSILRNKTIFVLSFGYMIWIIMQIS